MSVPGPGNVVRSLILALALIAAAPCPAEEVVFAIGEWAPYTGEREPELGGATALVTAACAAAGVKPVYRFFPWARAEQAVLDGTAFATFPYQRVADDPSFRYSAPLFGGVWRVFHHRANPAIPAGFAFSGVADLKGLRVASVLGYARINADLDHAGITIDPTPDMDAAFRKLAARRVDAVVEDQAVGLAVLARVAPAQQAEIGFLATPFGDPAGCTYLLKAARRHPQTDRLLARLDAGIAAIRADGNYERIVQRFHLRPSP